MEKCNGAPALYELASLFTTATLCIYEKLPSEETNEQLVITIWNTFNVMQQW